MDERSAFELHGAHLVVSDLARAAQDQRSLAALAKATQSAISVLAEGCDLDLSRQLDRAAWTTFLEVVPVTFGSRPARGDLT